MQVSISKAASMVGITRATLYRHIKKKGITVLKDEDNNPKIDVSELIRVYGEQVKVPNKAKKNAPVIVNDMHIENTAHKTETGSISAKINKAPSKRTTEVELLRERIKHYECEKTTLQKERARERDQLIEQIESLKKVLGQSQEQQHRLTALLTDQTEKSKSIYAVNTNDQEFQSRQIETMKDSVQRLENQNKRIAFELQREKNKKFFKRVFGT